MKRKGKTKRKVAFKRKRKKRINPGVNDSISRKVVSERGIVFPLSKNPWPKYIEACLTSNTEYTLIQNVVAGGLRSFVLFTVNASAYQPFNTTQLTATPFGVNAINPTFSATQNCQGFLDMISTANIGTITGGLYLFYAPLSAKLTITPTVQVQADSFDMLIYGTKSTSSLPVVGNWQDTMAVPNSVLKTFKEFSGTAKSISCVVNVGRTWGVNKQEVGNDIGAFAGARTTQPPNGTIFVCIMQSNNLNYQTVANAWPTNALGVSLRLRLEVWTRFQTRANESLST